MAILTVFQRKVGADDLAIGSGSYTYVDENGAAHTIASVNASTIPFVQQGPLTVENIADGSKSVDGSFDTLGVGGAATFDDSMTVAGQATFSTLYPHGPGTAPTQAADLADKAYVDAKWATYPARTYRIVHTWAIPGEIKVQVGSSDYLLPMYVPVPAAQSMTIVAVVCEIYSGTGVTFDIYRKAWGGAEAAIAGFTGVVASTTPAITTPAAVALADKDRIRPVVSAVSLDTPTHLTISIFYDITV